MHSLAGRAVRSELARRRLPRTCQRSFGFYLLDPGPEIFDVGGRYVPFPPNKTQEKMGDFAPNRLISVFFGGRFDP